MTSAKYLLAVVFVLFAIIPSSVHGVSECYSFSVGKVRGTKECDSFFSKCATVSSSLLGGSAATAVGECVPLFYSQEDCKKELGSLASVLGAQCDFCYTSLCNNSDRIKITSVILTTILSIVITKFF